MAHWLMKSEPHVYSWDDLVRDGGTEWDGVRNNAARLHLRAMREGDEAFFYHSGEQKAVVGVMRIAREGRPDGEDGAWVSVRVEPVRAMKAPVTLSAIKAERRLDGIELVRQSRLSVAPIRDAEWAVVEEMGEG
jgi:predicted RNA-binding protein with PUA-like domain